MFHHLSLSIRSNLLLLRSRHGFATLLAGIRLAGFLVIILRYWTKGEIASITRDQWFWVYLVFTISIGLVILWRHSQFDTNSFYIFVFTVDTIGLNYLIARTQDYGTDLYVLLLIPLIGAAHFITRWYSAGLAVVIIGSYLFAIWYAGAGVPFERVLGIGAIRSIFLLSVAGLYRVQRSLPRPKESKIISPIDARRKLIGYLEDLRKSIDYDTVSVQILYRNRLQIVACLGFEENEEDVYRIEFPIDDERFPNHLVIDSHRALIADPNEYPSFQGSQYYATHIKTWLGVPLISPATGEIFGLISIDSCKPNAYSLKDRKRASWFARRASAFLIEAALGPAALTLATKRESIDGLLKLWANMLPHKTAGWEDDIQAVENLVEIGAKLFFVEDCSAFFLRHVHIPDADPEPRLHLIASTAIPPTVFRQHESRVTGRHGDGLTGWAVNYNITANLGEQDIESSPHRTNFTGHLDYLFSHKSKQILIVPLRDSTGRANGAIKLENKRGWPSGNRFLPIEQRHFEIFAEMVSLMLENIRQRNYINRQFQIVHDLRGSLHNTGSRLIDEFLSANPSEQISPETRALIDGLRVTLERSKEVTQGILTDTGQDLVLEKEGVVPAIYNILDSLVQSNIDQIIRTRNLIHVDFQEIRDELPYRVRTMFYYIAHEAIRNIIRHSGIADLPDGHAMISFTKVEQAYQLTVQDNGRGFDVAIRNQPGENFGLKDMEKQVHRVKKASPQTELRIESVLGEGTRIQVIWIPEKRGGRYGKNADFHL